MYIYTYIYIIYIYRERGRERVCVCVKVCARESMKHGCTCGEVSDGVIGCAAVAVRALRV